MRWLLLASFGVVAATPAYWKSVEGDPIDPNTKQTSLHIGVSIAGPEFGTQHPDFCNHRPGKFGRDYSYNSERTVAYFCEKRFRLLRIPLSWERLQPHLGQKLNPNEIDRLRTFVQWAKRYGGKVIFDLHNFGRYKIFHNGRAQEIVIDQKHDGQLLVSAEQLADFWIRISKAFENEKTVHAFGIMNEPHDMGSSDWKAISQKVVNALRKSGDKTLLFIAGDGWSNAHRWKEVNGEKSWIKDAADNFAYEAHCYFDHDFSGKYAKSYDEELKADAGLLQRPIKRLKPFVDWCNKNKVRGFIGEFGAPLKDARWRKILVNFVKELERIEMKGCYWAAGEWWGDYPLSIQPRDHFRIDAPLLRELTQ